MSNKIEFKPGEQVCITYPKEYGIFTGQWHAGQPIIEMENKCRQWVRLSCLSKVEEPKKEETK